MARCDAELAVVLFFGAVDFDAVAKSVSASGAGLFARFRVFDDFAFFRAKSISFWDTMNPRALSTLDFFANDIGISFKLLAAFTTEAN